MITKPTILVVDDTPANLQLMSGLLQDDYKVKAATSGEKALKIAFTDPQPDLILLDIMMPEMDGYEVCKRLKADEKTNQIPIIFLTAKAETQDEALGLSLGAVDYITKPVSPPIAIARIKTHIELYRQKRELIESQRLLAEEINEAAIYIRSLLPLPLEGKVNTSWQHIPCSSLGGDALGHHWIDEDHLGIYLVDVCGHGVGAAILCISAINAIRSQSLTDTNFRSPASVLKGLNEAFPMEEQNNKYFTIWYGVYKKKNHELDDGGVALKSLTGIDQYPDFVKKLRNIFCLTEWHCEYFKQRFPPILHNITVPFYYGIDINKFLNTKNIQKGGSLIEKNLIFHQ